MEGRFCFGTASFSVSLGIVRGNKEIEMGAWSHEPFGNDTACDWSYGLLEMKDLSAVHAALDAVVEIGDEYLDADLACEAVAAIEVVAKLLGKGTQADSYTEDIDQWVKENPQHPDGALLKKARQALDRIMSKDSELLELWHDSDDASAWESSMKQLRDAVRA